MRRELPSTNTIVFFLVAFATGACGSTEGGASTSDGSGGSASNETSSGAGGSGSQTTGSGGSETSTTSSSTTGNTTVVGTTSTTTGSAGSGGSTGTMTTTTTGAGGMGASTGSGGSTSTNTSSAGTGGTGITPPDPVFCDGDPCVPGAECDEATGFCECAAGYEGDGWWCLSTDPCDDSPCQNGGTCHPTIGDRVLCTCPDGFGGVNCEIACSGEITIPDANFAAAVRSAAFIEDGQPITAEALADVTSMSIFDTPIADLTGIECMTSLSWITMSEVGLTDLSPFAALPKLTSLQVDCNSITDISSVASLINLTTFTIGKSSSCEAPGQVTDISALRDLLGLTIVDLSGHDITSLAALGPLKHLQFLVLASNANLASLAGLENASFLDYFVATDTMVSDISLFADHPALRTLWLSGSQVSDLSPLLSASVLEDLYIQATPVDCDAQADNLAQLVSNGVSVSSDCD